MKDVLLSIISGAQRKGEGGTNEVDQVPHDEFLGRGDAAAEESFFLVIDRLEHPPHEERLYDPPAHRRTFMTEVPKFLARAEEAFEALDLEGGAEGDELEEDGVRGPGCGGEGEGSEEGGEVGRGGGERGRRVAPEGGEGLERCAGDLEVEDTVDQLR